jgi:hypothetical protein
METDDSRFNRVLESYKTLLSFQMWSYDTYTRDFNYYLAIEVIALGLVLRIVVGQQEVARQNALALGMIIGLGVLLTLVWQSRQWRAFYFTRNREEELRKLETELQSIEPNLFTYFTKAQIDAKKKVEHRFWMGLIGERLRILPNLFRSHAYLRRPYMQQIFLISWLASAALLLGS